MLFLLLSFVDDFIYMFHSIVPLWGYNFHVKWWEEAKTNSFDQKVIYIVSITVDSSKQYDYS